MKYLNYLNTVILLGGFCNAYAEEQEIWFWDCVKHSEQCDPVGRVIKNDLFDDAGMEKINMWQLYLSLPEFIADGPTLDDEGVRKATAIIVTNNARHLFPGDGAQSDIEINVIEWRVKKRSYMLDVTSFAVGDEEYHYLFRLKGVPGGWEVMSVKPIVNENCCR